MDSLSHYLARANQILAEKSPAEKKYDSEVLRWLNRGKSIQKAVAKANEKHPEEALIIKPENIADIERHYKYLADHESIIKKLQQQ